jgi:prepilin peptidase CpaA
MLLQIAQLVLFPALMAFAASSDLLTMKIPNQVSLVLLAGFCALAFFTGMSLTEFGWHIAAGTTVLAIAFAFFAFGWIGGGDAKLAAATGLWFGFGHLIDYALYASLLGGALTLLLIQARKLPLPSPLAHQQWVLRLHDREGGIPYGIALAAAALIVYPHTIWMSAAQ